MAGMNKLKCPTCLDLFNDPVQLPCGHHFCLTCIHTVWDMDVSEEGPFFCPECQVLLSGEVTLQVNTNLQKEVEKFCMELGQEKVLEVNETQLLYRKQQVEQTLKGLDSLSSKATDSAAAYRARISAKYDKMISLIVEDKRLMMRVLDGELMCLQQWIQMKKEALDGHGQYIDKQIKKLNSLATDPVAFMQLLSHRRQPLELQPMPRVEMECYELEKMRTVEKLVDELALTLSHLRRLTLDSLTAHPKLEVSTDQQKVCWNKQDTGRNHFHSPYSILAQDTFSSKQHYWEVVVNEKPYWSIGVSYGTGLPNVWSIYHGNGPYLASSKSQDTLLSVEKKIKKLGVWVDFSKGVVSFYNADTLDEVHTFPVQLVEPVLPVLNPCICINNQNHEPLILFHLGRG